MFGCSQSQEKLLGTIPEGRNIVYKRNSNFAGKSFEQDMQLADPTELNIQRRRRQTTQYKALPA